MNVHYKISFSSKIPSFVLILQKDSLSNGFVNMSASWSWVSTYVISTSPLRTWSLLGNDVWCICALFLNVLLGLFN